MTGHAPVEPVPADEARGYVGYDGTRVHVLVRGAGVWWSRCNMANSRGGWIRLTDDPVDCKVCLRMTRARKGAPESGSE